MYPKIIKQPNSRPVSPQTNPHYNRLQENKTLPPAARYKKNTNANTKKRKQINKNEVADNYYKQYDRRKDTTKHQGKFSLLVIN